MEGLLSDGRLGAWRWTTTGGLAGAVEVEEVPGEYADFDGLLLSDWLASQMRPISTAIPTNHLPADELPDGCAGA